MSTKNRKKLSLNRTTLMILSTPDLNGVVGGQPRYTKYSVCAGTGGTCLTDVNATCRTQNY